MLGSNVNSPTSTVWHFLVSKLYNVTVLISFEFIPRATTREAERGSEEATGFAFAKISENFMTMKPVVEFATAKNWSSGLLPPKINKINLIYNRI